MDVELAAYNENCSWTLKGKRTPLFVNANQVLFAGNLLLIAFVSYFGGKFHRPKIIALGCTVFAFGCLLTSFPHFLFGR